MANLQSIKAADLEFLEGSLMPEFSRKTPTIITILEMGELTDEHIQAAEEHLESGATLGVQSTIQRNNLQTIRHTHHRMAQLLVMGVPPMDVSRQLGVSPSHISILRSTPAFQELEAHYAENVRDTFVDFVEQSKDLSLDLLSVIRERLEVEPEKIPLSTLNELLKTISDRAGYAPTQKTVNLNVNTNMGERLKAARERAAEAERFSALPPPLQ